MDLNEEACDLLIAGLQSLQIMDRFLPDPNPDRGERQAEVIKGLIGDLRERKENLKNMDNYKWDQEVSKHHIELWHLYPQVEGVNGNLCRACLTQTGEERFSLTMRKSGERIATYSGFPSVEAAKRFAEQIVEARG